MKIILLFFLLSLSPLLVVAQVEHNFRMDPQNTDCHKLELSSDMEQNIKKIRQSKFRVSEQLQLSRYSSPRKLDYYSCDGKVGYVISSESETQEILFSEINKTRWDSLVNADDPIGFYKTYFRYGE